MAPRHLSRDEFSTLLQEAASIVNNTPLWEASYSPDDPFPLTPANLLTLKTSHSPPSIEEFFADDLLSYGRKRWRRTQYLAQQFWARWRTEYVHLLQMRHKWRTKKPCATAGDVVLIRDKTASRNRWPVGIIEDVRTSLDGLVRSVNIRLPPLNSTGPARYTSRAIHDLILLIPASSHTC